MDELEVRFVDGPLTDPKTAHLVWSRMPDISEVGDRLLKSVKEKAVLEKTINIHTLDRELTVEFLNKTGWSPNSWGMWMNGPQIIEVECQEDLGFIFTGVTASGNFLIWTNYKFEGKSCEVFAWSK